MCLEASSGGAKQKFSVPPDPKWSPREKGPFGDCSRHISVCPKAAFIMYAKGGGRGFFFQRLVFLYPPPRSIQIFRTPQAISRKINTPPSPLPPPKKYQNKYLYNSKLYMFEISRDMFNKNIERALTVYVIPMPASLSSAN